MKYMITGGNTGLGERIKQRYGCDSFSRSNGHDIGVDRTKLAETSLGYDVMINNAYDHTFNQVLLLQEIALLWKQKNKSGIIINIGGVGSEDYTMCAGWEHYNSTKRALKHQSLQWTQEFKLGNVRFRTSLLTLDRLDTPAGRTTPQWTGNGVDLDDICHMIQLCIDIQGNTCIGEIKSWVNLDYQMPNEYS